MQAPLNAFTLSLIGLLGLIVGSFLNVVISRYPRMLTQRWQKECQEYLKLNEPVKEPSFNLAIPASHCVHCKHPLAWQELIPLFSYLWLKGKCRYCAAKISWQYPLVELLNALILVLIVMQYGFNPFAYSLILVSEILLSLVFIDLNTQLLPDELTLSLLWIGLIFSATTSYTIEPASAILAASLGYLLPWTVNYLYRLIRKHEGMGYGDFKCFAALGAWLGLQKLPLLFLFAVFLGLLFALIALALQKIKYQQKFPFGPAIIIAGWLLMLAPSQIEMLWSLVFRNLL